MNVQTVPTVSVYITNHNYEKYLETAINSVLNQRYNDWELIIIDDGSTDNSRQIIEKYENKENVAAIYQTNKGLNITNNIAIRASRGKYILRLDADDFLDENALTILTDVLERNPNIGLVFPDYYVVDENGEIMELVRRHDFKKVTLFDQPAHGACTLIRKKCLLELGGYDEEFRCQDGYDLWVRFIERYQAQNVNLPLFYYRQHFNNLTSNEQMILQTRSKIIEREYSKNHSEKRVLAIIPVRGSHIDPRSSPFRKLGGVPLIDWTIQGVLKAKTVTDVLVTTPDEKILQYIKDNYGSRVISVKRERNLARINVYIEHTILHALKEYEKSHQHPDSIVILYIESPFRKPEEIDDSIRIMEIFGTDRVVGVRPDNGIFYRHGGNGLESLRSDQTLKLEREDIFREAGQINAIKREFFERNQHIFGGKVGHIIVDQCSAIRLNSEWDWEIAEQQAGKNFPQWLQKRG